MMTLKDRLLSITANRCEAVTIPGVGDVHVHAMNEVARANFEAVAGKDAAQKQIKRLLVVCTVRESADPVSPFVFSADDIGEMGKMDSLVVNRLAEVAMRISGLGADADLESLLGKPVKLSATPETQSSATLSV